MAAFPYQSLGALSAAPRLFTGISQGIKANNLKLVDSITPEEREALELARQRAAAVSFPGQTVLRGRLAMGQNAALQTAMLGSGSAADLLGAAVAIDRNRANGEAQLGAQGEQFNARAQAELGPALQRRAQQRRADLAVYNNTKAALTEAAARNTTDAADTVAAYGAYGLNQERATPAPVPAGEEAALTTTTPTVSVPAYTPAPAVLPDASGRYYPGITGTRGYRTRLGSARDYRGLGIRY